MSPPLAEPPVRPLAADAAAELWSTSFRREREASWRRLDAMLARAEAKGREALSSAELAALPALYRMALSSLGIARSVCLDQALLQYLEVLVARAYACVYAPRVGFFGALGRFLREGFPAAVRASRWHLVVAAASLSLGVVVGAVLTTVDPDLYWVFVPDAQADGRHPGADTAELRRTLYGGGDREELTVFAAFLFTHNARIGILAFGLGFAVGVPVVLLLLYNGFGLGAMTALFHSRGLGIEWWAWILPHGVSELLAVALCGAAGLVIGESLVFPGTASRLANLARRGRVAGTIVVGSMAMFLVAGGVEGIFRQTVHAVDLRFLLAGMTGVSWTLYFVLAGRRRR